MALAFGAVVTATVDVIMDIVGKVGGTPDFSNYEPAGISLGAWLTALISFLVMAAVVYFLIVMPHTKAQERYFPKEEAGEPADVALLTQIRDLLEQGRASTEGSHRSL
ncbi:MAG: MscL family protein [Nocardioides sp.]